ncbi:SIR2 family protein [Aeromonas jandaei]|nr:SIR2 family protein [Aeromonas jandaei]
MKREIAALTSWYPDKEKREKFSRYLEFLSPSWIITTNYDMVIESLLTGKSIPLGPNDSLSSPDGVIPVFHLHGLRTNPEEIIIAQEDYVTLFRPSEYRQIKLALTIKESTTLLLGYGLGDVNVLTALDWSRNVFKSEEANYPNGVVQVLRKDNPTEEPYRDKNGIVIIEVEDLSDFFEDFIEVRTEELDEKKKEQKALKRLANQLDAPDGEMIEKFIDDEEFRSKMLKTLSRFSIHLVSGFVSFLNKCIDETWARSRPDGAFEGYNQNLIIILDILTAFPISRFPPALFQTAAYGLQRVGYYVGDCAGKSWAAKKTWDKRKNELSKEIVDELKSIASQHGYAYVERLAKTIKV